MPEPSTEYIDGSCTSFGNPFIPNPLVGTRKITGALGFAGTALTGCPGAAPIWDAPPKPPNLDPVEPPDILPNPPP